MLLYCNTQCQRKDWPNHRYICAFRNNPPLAVRSSLVDKHMQKKNPANRACVEVIAVIKSNLFYVRSVDFFDSVAYYRIINEIRRDAINCHPLQNMPNVGDLVITNMDDTGSKRFCRALVLKACAVNKIQVIFLEFGHVVEKDLSELLTPTRMCYLHPQLVVPLIIENIRGENGDQYIHAVSRYVMGKKYNLCINKITQSIIKGDLEDSESTRKLSEYISELIAWKHGSSVLPWIKYIPEWKSIELNVVDVSALKQTQLIACIPTNEVKGLKKFIQGIQSYSYLNAMPYLPKLNEYCIVYNNANVQWSRGKCIYRIDNHHVQVKYFDYGNRTDTVHKSKIQKYPPEFDYPIVTINCKIYGLPDNLNQQAVEKLKQLLQGNRIVANRISKGEQECHNIVHLDTILGKLLRTEKSKYKILSINFNWFIEYQERKNCTMNNLLIIHTHIFQEFEKYATPSI